jgi:phenylacetaldehyde dehydrogenase
MRFARFAPGGAVDLVAGEVVTPADVVGMAVDPSTGDPLADLRSSSDAQLEAALETAYRAWDHGTGPLSGLPLAERTGMLERLADALDARCDELAFWHACETGIPIATARLFAGGLGDTARRIAEEAPGVLAPRALPAGARRVEILRLPWGPAALFTAWNASAFLAVTKLSYALAAGCPAILKPSEYAGETTRVLVDALLEAELGPAAVQVVSGDGRVGARLAGDARVRMVNFTGSLAGGRAVAQQAAPRMAALQLELGASNPAVVTADADLASAGQELARAAVVLNGQWCEAPRRVFVDGAVHDDLVAEIRAALEPLVLGDALAEETQIGPLGHPRQHEAVREAAESLARAGDAVATHSVLPDAGCYCSPTIVSNLRPEDATGEIFGPILAVSPFAAVEDAIRSANALGDGLAGYVFAAEPAAFELGRRLHAGEIRLNGARVLDLAPGSAQSFWGTSGVGGHGLTEVLSAHAGIRIVGEEEPSLVL